MLGSMKTSASSAAAVRRRVGWRRNVQLSCSTTAAAATRRSICASKLSLSAASGRSGAAWAAGAEPGSWAAEGRGSEAVVEDAEDAVETASLSKVAALVAA